MSDVYIYYFTLNKVGGENSVSSRPATLEAIKGRGRPLMESQMVVDHTELGKDGFLVGRNGSNWHDIGDIAAQIWSLEVRGASRDNEAVGSSDGIEKYMLGLESRELRNRARHLKSRRLELSAGESCCQIGARDFIHFGAGLVTA